MRCIETLVLDFYSRIILIKSNMRCIETLQDKKLKEGLSKIKSNMRCIETMMQKKP